MTHRLLPLDGLRYGLGREAFPALIEPRFVQLIRHEVVNDTIGGRAIFAAYCIRADLGAIYDREMDGHAFTFALSGYTCSHPDVWDGRDAFASGYFFGSFGVAKCTAEKLNPFHRNQKLTIGPGMVLPGTEAVAQLSIFEI